MKDAEGRVALYLELVSGLARRTRPQWTLEEWQRLLKGLFVREARVVVLHTLWDMGFREIGERLGCSRGRTHQLWAKALQRLSTKAEELR